MVVSVLVLSLSVWGLGKESHDSSSAAYQAANMFAIISAFSYIVVLLFTYYLLSKASAAGFMVSGPNVSK